LSSAWRAGIPAALDDVAHDDLLDVGGGNAGAFERRANRDRAKLGRRDRGETAKELPDRRAGRGDDDRNS
jgi:hypothetical protein